MTPYEFSLYLQGRGEAADDVLRSNARMAAWIMTPHYKKAINPAHLIGKSRSFEGMTREEIREYYRKKRAQARARR